jgi:predicted DNA-binding transcriptional regulator YafY
MPVNKEAYIRYRILDSCLRNKARPFPSMDELIQACTDVLGKAFSNSTIQKDLYDMRYDEGLGFLAPISFNRAKSGYQYTDPNYTISSIPLNDGDISAITFAASVLSQFSGLGPLKQYSEAIQKILDAVQIQHVMGDRDEREWVQVETATLVKGTEWLGPIMESIRDKKPVQIMYSAFDHDKLNEYIIHPYLLKEYRNRWYLIGSDHQRNVIRTFGLDRITDVNQSDIVYKLNTSFDPEVYFKHAIGITVSDMKPRLVELSFTPMQGKYLKTQPLHSSQKILKDDSSEFRISIDVLISYELITLIKSYGADVKVLSPKDLSDQIAVSHKQAFQLYSA